MGGIDIVCTGIPGICIAGTACTVVLGGICGIVDPAGVPGDMGLVSEWEGPLTGISIAWYVTGTTLGDVW